MDLPAINTTFVPVATNPVDGTPAEDEPLPPMPFLDMVKLSVDRAVRELADQIWGITQSGAVPFLIGPTGCGKTSANRLMAIDHGMLFVMPQADIWPFWMHDTRIPLDIIFLDSAGKVLDIHNRAPLDETGRGAASPTLYVIELNLGVAEKIGLKKGDSIEIPKKYVKN